MTQFVSPGALEEDPSDGRKLQPQPKIVDETCDLFIGLPGQSSVRYQLGKMNQAAPVRRLVRPPSPKLLGDHVRGPRQDEIHLLDMIPVVHHDPVEKGEKLGADLLLFEAADVDPFCAASGAESQG